MFYAVDQGYYSKEFIDSSFLERVQKKFECVEMDTDHSGCGKEAMRGRHPQFQPQWRRFVWCECRGWRLPASPPHWKPRTPPSAPLLLPWVTSLRGFQEFYLQPSLHYTAFQSTISVNFKIRIDSQTGHRGSFSAVQELETLWFHQKSSSSWISRHSKIRDEKIRVLEFQGSRVSHSIGGVLASNKARKDCLKTGLSS